jgi:hypothetical protein
MARQLTEKQQKFLDVLFEEARGNLHEAKKLAGYAPDQSTNLLVNLSPRGDPRAYQHLL